MSEDFECEALKLVLILSIVYLINLFSDLEVFDNEVLKLIDSFIEIIESGVAPFSTIISSPGKYLGVFVDLAIEALIGKLNPHELGKNL